MKLFGGTGKQLHSGNAKKAGESGGKKLDLNAFFHSPVWKKLRVPLIALGCVVLFFLLALLIYNLWERPPETEADGPRTQPTAAPVVLTPAPTAAVLPAVTPSPTEQPDETPEPTPEPVTSGRRENCYTFVILAYDQMEANTDTILVGRMDTDAGTLDLVNLPRDTLVNVSWGVKKLSTVLASERGDMSAFLEHLGDLVGFTADCYAIVNIQAVEKLVDCIGGVYYNVPRDMDYDDPTQDLYIHIPMGEQHLNGEQAVQVLRYRMGNNGTGYPNGDLGRIATQQDFLKSIAGQFLQLGNIPNLSTAIDIFQSNIQTDLTANNIAFFVREFLKLDKENVRFHTLPGQGATIRGGSYWEVKIDAWVELLNTNLNPYRQEITADNLNILRAAGEEGAVSTTGETVPLESFLDYTQFR
ncbi:MAG: hypothetical protein E7427_08625 [Ruminococcaceae bacterium]|nr:hypothetical protein [Oscillospiraceae bacterium]